MKAGIKIRPPAVAGQFYPGGARELQGFVTSALSKAVPVSGKVKGVIGPHAGYPYSGDLCARVIGAVSEKPARIWLLGPSHHVALERWTGCSHLKMATPLEETPVDRGTVDRLVRDEGVEISDRAHAPEHSLETHLPFLQTRWPDVPVIPLLSTFRDEPREIDWLASALQEEDLVVISSDLSHFYAARDAERLDAAFQKAVEEGDADHVGPEQACGWVAVRTLLRLAKRLGWTATTVGRTTSAAVTGDTSSVVGYGGWIFTEAA